MKKIISLFILVNCFISYSQSEILDEIQKIDKKIPNHTGWKDKSFENLLKYKQEIDSSFFSKLDKELFNCKHITYYIYLGSLPNHGKIQKLVILKVKNLNNDIIFTDHYTIIDNNKEQINQPDEFLGEYFNFLSTDYTKTKGLKILKYTDGSETFHSLDYHMIEFIYEINLETVSDGMIFSSFNYYASEKMMEDFFEE